MDLESTQQWEYLINFIIDNIQYTFFEKILLKLFKKNKKYKKVLNVLENWTKFWYTATMFSKIIESHFRNNKSIFININAPIKDRRPSIFSTNIQSVCKYYNMSPEEVMNSTLEQYGWYLEGLTFIWNEYSKEGKKRNDIATDFNKQLQEEGKANSKRIREQFAKFGILFPENKK